MMHYKTTNKKCLCSEHKSASSNYRCNMLCSHRILKEAFFPEIPQVDIILTHQFDQLTIDYDFLPAETSVQNETTEDINYITRTIKFFLHYYENNGFYHLKKLRTNLSEKW